MPPHSDKPLPMWLQVILAAWVLTCGFAILFAILRAICNAFANTAKSVAVFVNPARCTHGVQVRTHSGHAGEVVDFEKGFDRSGWEQHGKDCRSCLEAMVARRARDIAEAKQRDEALEAQRLHDEAVRELEYKRRREWSERAEEQLVRERNRLLGSLQKLTALSPEQFEQLVGVLYKKLGYEVTVTPYGNDGGVDVVAIKDGVRFAIQCKRYARTKSVGRPEVQQLLGARHGADCQQAIFVTTSTFTESAVAYATKVGIALVDGKKLQQLVKRFMPYSQGDRNVLSLVCTQCGELVVFKRSGEKFPRQRKCSHDHVVYNCLLD